jgi:hypothetical protein
VNLTVRILPQVKIQDILYVVRVSIRTYDTAWLINEISLSYSNVRPPLDLATTLLKLLHLHSFESCKFNEDDYLHAETTNLLGYVSTCDVITIVDHRHTTVIRIRLLPQMNTPQQPSHIFKICLYKTTLSSRKRANARMAALNAVKCCLDEQGEIIRREYGNEDCFVVI